MNFERVIANSLYQRHIKNTTKPLRWNFLPKYEQLKAVEHFSKTPRLKIFDRTINTPLDMTYKSKYDRIKYRDIENISSTK